MMEDHEFCDKCPGCRPAIMDATTGEVFAPDSEIMIAVNEMWDNDTTYEERKAFIEMTLHNSRNPILMERAKIIFDKVESIMEEHLKKE